MCSGEIKVSKKNTYLKLTVSTTLRSKFGINRNASLPSLIREKGHDTTSY